MDYFKSKFKREFETPEELERLDVNDILRIPPNKISTTKIIAQDDAQIKRDKQKAMDPIKKKAVKFIARQKEFEREHGDPYPSPDEMVRLFKNIQKTDQEAADIIEAAMAGRLGGGRARRQSKKRQLQRKRKSQRRRRYTRNRS